MTEFLLGIVVTILFPRAITALRRAWEAAAPTAPTEAAGLSPEEIVAAVKSLPPQPEILGALAEALKSLRERVEPPKK